MKYLCAIFLSAFFFLGMIRPTIDIDFWHKVRYNKEYYTKEEKRKEYKISVILWAIFTFLLFVFVIFFVD